MKTSSLEKIYGLHEDKQHIKDVQEATLNTEEFGLKPTHGLFGTKEWREAIENGLIKKVVLEGVISRVYMSGHNDFPEFELSSRHGKTSWQRLGNDEAYVVGRRAKVIYVVQEFKKPIGRKGQKGYLPESCVVLEIWIECV